MSQRAKEAYKVLWVVPVRYLCHPRPIRLLENRQGITPLYKSDLLFSSKPWLCWNSLARGFAIIVNWSPRNTPTFSTLSHKPWHSLSLLPMALYCTGGRKILSDVTVLYLFCTSLLLRWRKTFVDVSSPVEGKPSLTAPIPHLNYSRSVFFFTILSIFIVYFNCFLYFSILWCWLINLFHSILQTNDDVKCTNKSLEHYMILRGCLVEWL